MVGGLTIGGSSTSMIDSQTCPCICVDSLSSSSMSFKSKGGDFVSYKNVVGGKKQLLRRKTGQLKLSSSFVDDGWQDWRLSKKEFSGIASRFGKKQRKGRSLVIANELAGQYEDSFEDVKGQIVNYFTYKAVRTVLSQLYELNPTQYRWFYDFLVKNKPGDAKSFLRMLTKEKQDLAERVMVTRLHLYGKWIKKCNHAEMYEEISNQNLELMRERLMETVKWPSDDTNSEKIG